MSSEDQVDYLWNESPELTWITVQNTATSTAKPGEGDKSGEGSGTQNAKPAPLVIGTTFLEFKQASYGHYTEGDLKVTIMEIPVKVQDKCRVRLLCRADVGPGEVWKKTDAFRDWKKQVRGKREDILKHELNQNVRVLIPRVGPQDIYEFRRMGKEKQLIIDEYGVFYGICDTQRLIQRVAEKKEEPHDQKQESDDPSVAEKKEEPNDQKQKSDDPIVALAVIVVITGENDKGQQVVKLSKARMPAGPRPGERIAMSRGQDKGGIWEAICNLLLNLETMRSGVTSTDLETYAKQKHRWRYFVLLDQGFLKDSINYTLLPNLGFPCKPDVKDTITKVLEGIVREHVSSKTQKSSNTGSMAQQEVVTWEQRYKVYGLMHQLYLLTVVGQSRMLEFYLSPTCPYPRCPYVRCKRTRCFPVGLSATYPSEPVKFYCPVCAQIYNPVDDQDNDIPGAFFGPSYIHLLLQRYPDLAQIPPDD